jgi:hypothetical protein
MLPLNTKLASRIALAASFFALHGCTDDAVVADCAPAFAAPPATSAAISEALERIKDKHKLNAIIVGVEQNGTPLYRTALGVSPNGVPATTEMHFRIGGVGWQMLSTILLRAVEQDPARIALTDRVSKWYPDYPNADRATVRMLAASSAGFGDYIVTKAFIAELEADPLRVWTADDLIARSVPPYQMPRFNNPGKDWKYSHTDFVVLGAVLEKASGKQYGAPAGTRARSPRVARYPLSARRAAATAGVAHVAGGRLSGFNLLESFVCLVGCSDVEHLRPRQVEPRVRHRVAAFAANERRDHFTGQCRTRPQYAPGLLRTWHARLSTMDCAASCLLGHAYDDGLRSHDGIVGGGNNLVESRDAAESAAEQ